MTFTIHDAAALAAPCRVMADLSEYERNQEEAEEQPSLWEQFLSDQEVFDNYWGDAAADHHLPELLPLMEALKTGDDLELGRQMRIMLHAYIDRCDERL